MINLMIEINGTEDVKQFTKMLEVIGVKIVPGSNNISVQDEVSGAETTILFTQCPNKPTVKVVEHLIGVQRVWIKEDSNSKQLDVVLSNTENQYVVTYAVGFDSQIIFNNLKNLGVTTPDTQILEAIKMIGAVVITDEKTLKQVESIIGVDFVCKNEMMYTTDNLMNQTVH